MNDVMKPQEFDSYEIEEPSDEERAASRWGTGPAGGEPAQRRPEPHEANGRLAS